MIVIEERTYNNTKFEKVHSDEGNVLIRDDGVEIWEDLIFPNEHSYTETDRKITLIPTDENLEALKILFGEA